MNSINYFKYLGDYIEYELPYKYPIIDAYNLDIKVPQEDEFCTLYENSQVRGQYGSKTEYDDNAKYLSSYNKAQVFITFYGSNNSKDSSRLHAENFIFDVQAGFINAYFREKNAPIIIIYNRYLNKRDIIYSKQFMSQNVVIVTINITRWREYQYQEINTIEGDTKAL